MSSPDRVPRLRGFSFYRFFVRPLLFKMDSERAHHLVLSIGRFFWRFAFARKCTRLLYARGVKPRKIRFGSLELENPLGLAAGFDKNAVLLPGIESLGFGFIEIGTVTPRPQAGNPKPRMSRIADRRALLNKMGFPNDGADLIAARLKAVRDRLSVPVGVNIGKNKDTPNEEALKDYDRLFKTFSPIASYFTVNVSSPNTPGLRDLQSAKFFGELGDRVQRQRLAQPVFVKLAPDLAFDDLKAIASLCGDGKPFTGLTLTNTIPTDLGGLSGYPLRGPSLHMLKMARTILDKNVPVISVGGIESAEDARERLEHGATAIQIYSALIYKGPGLPGEILRGV